MQTIEPAPHASNPSTLSKANETCQCDGGGIQRLASRLRRCSIGLGGRPQGLLRCLFMARNECPASKTKPQRPAARAGENPASILTARLYLYRLWGRGPKCRVRTAGSTKTEHQGLGQSRPSGRSYRRSFQASHPGLGASSFSPSNMSVGCPTSRHCASFTLRRRTTVDQLKMDIFSGGNQGFAGR